MKPEDAAVLSREHHICNQHYQNPDWSKWQCFLGNVSQKKKKKGEMGGGLHILFE